VRGDTTKPHVFGPVLAGLGGAPDPADAAALGHGDVVVDLSEVQFVDRAIVKVLVHRQELLESQSRRLTLRAPSTFVQRVLDVCGLVELVEGDPAVGGPPQVGGHP
jgi:hypothetical protein